jgi:hypothetical protein
MRLANCFSGGVFLALAFGHLLPHSVDHFNDLLVNKQLAATLASAVCAAGYLLVRESKRLGRNCSVCLSISILLPLPQNSLNNLHF